MMDENSLMQKLVMAKKVMDIHNSTPRGAARNINMPSVETFDVPNATYNIPQDIMSEQVSIPKQAPSSEVPTKDRILNSKLPDEIKRLMIEHPIAQPASMTGPSISEDVVNKAARLMKENLFSDDNPKTTQKTQRQPQGQSQGQSVPGNVDLKKLVKEAVREILSESGLLTESTSKSNDQFTFRVGQHIFEGKISKIKKLK